MTKAQKPTGTQNKSNTKMPTQDGRRSSRGTPSVEHYKEHGYVVKNTMPAPSNPDRTGKDTGKK